MVDARRVAALMASGRCRAFQPRPFRLASIPQEHRDGVRTLSGLLKRARCPLASVAGGCCHLADGIPEGPRCLPQSPRQGVGLESFDRWAGTS